MTKFRVVTLTAAIMLIGTIASSTAYADSTGQLEEVIVTAEKVKANAQKTAISMQVIKGETLKEEAKKSLSDILEDATGVMTQQTQTGPQFSVRGVGPQGRPGGESPVAVYVDGVYNNNPTTLRGSMLDVGQVEVLKGPQGTLYGRNAMAGAVNVTANQPVFKNEGNASVELGNYGRVASDGVLNAKISDNQAIRFAFTTEKHDGYFTNGTSDADDLTARVKYRYQPNADLNIVVTAETQVSGGKGSGQALAPSNWPDRSDWQPWVSTDNNASSQKSETNKLHATVEWITGLGTVSFIPNIADSTFASKRFVNNSNQIEDRKKHAYGYELRLASLQASAMQWQVGYNYSYQNEPRSMYNALASGAIDTTGPVETWKINSSTSKSVFGQITLPVTDTARLIAGLRKNMDSKSADGIASGMGPDLHVMGTVNFDKVTGVLGAQWDVTPSSMLYLTHSIGYQSGNTDFDRTTGVLVQGKSQVLAQSAFGSKNRFLDNKLQLNAEAYLSKYTNYQISGLGNVDVNGDTAACAPFCPPGTISVTTDDLSEGTYTLKNVIIKGIDFDAAYQLTTNDRISGNLAYLDAKIGDQGSYDGTYASNSTIIAGTGLTVAQTFQAYLDAYGNKILQHSPKWVANLNYTHRWDFASGATLSLRGNVKFSTGYYSALGPNLDLSINNYKFYQPNHHISNLYLTYDSPDGTYAISGYVKNLENYALVNNSNPNMDNSIALNMGDPRTYGVSFQYRF